MSRLQEITEYKNEILRRIINDQEICKAVYYNERNFLDQPDLSLADRESLVYERLFPFDFIPSSAEELKNKRTYITLSVTDFRKAGSVYFQAGNIYVCVFTHKELYRTDHQVLRIDYLMYKLNELLDSERGIGIGKLEFVEMKEYRINSDYQGSYLHYRPVDIS